MADARASAQWKHTSAILAMLFNSHRSRDQEPKGPEQFDPTAVASATVTRVSLRHMKGLFQAVGAAMSK